MLISRTKILARVDGLVNNPYIPFYKADWHGTISQSHFNHLFILYYIIYILTKLW